MKKKFIFITTCMLIVTALMTTNVIAQEKRASPPKVSTASVNGNTITINYSSPAKKEREIYGSLVPYGQVWRTGANEATTIELTSDANIGGADIKAGKYALFTIPGEKEWTIIINSDAKQWGAYKYKKDNDVARFKVPSTAVATTLENFTISINDSGAVTLIWDKTRVNFAIK